MASGYTQPETELPIGQGCCSTKLCQNISFKKTSLYKCLNCSTDSYVEVYCENCIAQHLRALHKILDNRGLEPPFCPTHFCLHEMYCPKCQVSCCHKPHPEHAHEKVNLVIKADEMRVSVDSFLESLKVNQKPLEDKRQSIKTACEIKESYETELLQILERTLDRFMRDVLASGRDKRSQEKLKEVESLGLKVPELICSAEKLNADLMSLLELSDGVLVQQFPKVKTKAADVLQKESDTDTFGLFVQRFDYREKVLQTPLEAAGQKLLEEIDFPKFNIRTIAMLEEKILSSNSQDILNESSSYFGRCGSLLLQVQTRGNLVNIIRLEASSQKVKQSSKVLTDHELPCELKQAYFISKNVVLHLLNGDVLALNLETLKLNKLGTEFSDVLTPYLIPGSDNVGWLYWDEKSKSVKSGELLQSKIFQMKLGKKPKAVFTLSVGENAKDSTVCFTDEHFNIFVVSLREIIPIEIKQMLHGMSRIDFIVVTRNLLFLWCFEPNFVTVMQRKQGIQWTLNKTFSWKRDESVLSFKESAQLPLYTFIHCHKPDGGHLVLLSNCSETTPTTSPNTSL